jgi:hypothetical protein
MATLTDLMNNVYTLTNRPDYVSETMLAVQRATLKAHQRDFYSKDLFETGIQFPSADYYQTLEPKSINAAYRSLKYLRKYDAVNSCPGKFLTNCGPLDLFDEYGYSKTDIYYQAGIEVNIRMSTQEQFMLLGMYVHPVVTEAGYLSWIADEFPDAIVAEAAANVFGSLGFIGQRDYYRKMVQEAYFTVDAANITLIGS